MQAIQIYLSGMIWWRLSPIKTMSMPIPALRGWCIASPLCIHARSIGPPPNISNVMPDGTILFQYGSLLLVNCDDTTNENLLEVRTSVTRFLNALRVTCKQPEMPRAIGGFSSAYNIDGVFLPHDLPTKTITGSIQKYILDSALTFEHILPASAAVINNEVPVHSEMINDASEAAITSNYRNAIILAAAAIEACAGSVLDNEYERLLESPDQSPKHRFITIQVNRNESVTKDPIYAALRNRAGDGGSRFLTLLHECPLYLLGRSLRTTHPELYRKSHSLYKTRNKLAHTGTVEDKPSGLLTVDFNGSMEAIRIANGVLNWFGESGTTIPDVKMVKIVATEDN